VAREGYRFVGAVETVAPVLEGIADSEFAAAAAPSEAVPARASVSTDRGWPQHDVRRSWWRVAAWSAVAVVIATALIAILRDEPGAAPTKRHPLRFALGEPAGATFSTSGGFMALSPDGRAIAFVATSADGVDRLWLQPLDSLSAKALPGTDHAVHPFWSPDSREVAFFAEGRLKRLDLASGSQRTLDAVSPSGFGGSWSDRGTMLYTLGRSATSSKQRGIMLGSAAGGAGSPLPVPAGVDPGAYLSWPRFLPGGQSFIFLVQAGDRERDGIWVASLDGGTAGRVVPVISSAEYADGRLFYVDRGVLLAQAFDAARRRTTGVAVPIADGVPVSLRTGRAPFAVSAANGGVLAYRRAARARLEWFDRSGLSLGVVGSSDLYRDFSVAPDGRRVAAAILDPRRATHDIWILGPGEAKTRFTSSPASEVAPQWSADGSRIAYASDADAHWEVLVKSVTEGGEPRKVAEAKSMVAPTGWVGRVLVIGRFNENLEVKLHPGAGIELEAGASMGILDAAAPDGRWLVHARDDSTTRVASRALHLDAVPSSRGSWHLATGASQPRWRSDSRELYYLAEDRRLMAVRVVSGASPAIEVPEPLFQTAGIEASGLEGKTYDAAPDGRRFLVKVPVDPSVIVVVANVNSLLEQSSSDRVAAAQWAPRFAIRETSFPRSPSCHSERLLRAQLSRRARYERPIR
jgi:hypothetical protein